LRRAKAWEGFSRGKGDTGTHIGALDRAKLAGHRAGAVDRHGRAQSEIGEIRHEKRCLTSGRSSGWLGTVSGELDGRGRGHGSPVASDGVGRARERVELCEMMRGSEWVRVGGCRGREFRRRARVRMHRSTARAGRAELTGRVHGAEREREKRGAWATTQRLAKRACEIEREEGCARAKQLAPTGRPQRAESERERARERKPPLTGGSHLSGGAGARARGLAGPSWAAFPFSFSLDFLIAFLFLFYRVFNSKFKLGFKFK
jgi:hypothetical protein